MAITVKHSPSAETLGETAYTIGRGAREERLNQQGFENNIRAISLDNQIKQAQESLDLRNRQLDIESQQNQDFTDYRNATLQENKRQFDTQLAARQQENENRPAQMLKEGMVQQELLRNRINWEYDDTQKREMQKITGAIAQIRKDVFDGNLKPQQAEVLEAQMWDKWFGITPLPKFNDKPTPNESFAERMIMNEDGSYSGKYLDEKGNVKIDPVYAQKSKEKIEALKSLQARQEKMIEMYMKERDAIEGAIEGDKRYGETSEQTRKRVVEAFRMFEEMPGMTASGNSTVAQSQNITKDANGNLQANGITAEIPAELKDLLPQLPEQLRVAAMVKVQNGADPKQVAQEYANKVVPTELKAIWDNMTSAEQDTAMRLINDFGWNPVQVYSTLIAQGLKPGKVKG